MTAPERRSRARQRALPAPELVSLTDGPEQPVDDDTEPWWKAVGGRLGPDGLVAFPSVITGLYPEPLPAGLSDCALCEEGGKGCTAAEK